MKRFSVITVCLNEAKSIRATCDSICAQSYKDFEWIVIDGASTDGTKELLNEYSSSIHLLVSEPDKGIYNAMNKGASKAAGTYIIFMNGGDCFASSEALEQASQAKSAQLLYGDVYLGNQNGELKIYPDIIGPGYLLNKMIPHQSTFYERATFEAFGGYDESFKIAADYDLNARLLEAECVTHCHILHPIAIFDLKGISNSKDFRSLRKQENHWIRKKYFKNYRYSMKCLRQEITNFISWVRRDKHCFFNLGNK